MKTAARFLCILVAVAILLSGCAKVTPVASPEATQGQAAPPSNVKLSMYLAPESFFAPYTPDIYNLKIVTQATGIQFGEITQGAYNEEDQVLPAILASGKIPDIVISSIADFANDDGPKGMFVRLDDYVKAGKLDNFAAVLAKFNMPIGDLAASDGHVYYAPVFDDGLWLNSAIIMRSDLLEKCGIIKDRNNPDPKAIQTVDDLLNAFRCLQKEMGGGPVVSSRDGFQSFIGDRAAPFFGTSVAQYYNPDTKQFEYGPLMNRYRIMLDFYKTLYSENILSHDYATMSDAELSAAQAEGKWGANIQNWGDQWAFVHLKAKGIDTGVDYYVQGLTIDGVKIRWVASQSNYGTTFNAFMISALSPQSNIDKAIELLNWLYSEDGILTTTVGVKGVDWKIKDNGQACVTGANFTIWAENTAGYCDPANIPTNVPDFKQTDMLGSPLSRFYNYGSTGAWINIYNKTSALDSLSKKLAMYQAGDSFRPADPVVILTADERTTVQDMQTALSTYVTEESEKFIEGTNPLNDETWAAFEAKVKELGGQKIADIYNTALARK